MNFPSQSKSLATLAITAAGFWTTASNAADGPAPATDQHIKVLEFDAPNPYQLQQQLPVQGRVPAAALAITGARGRTSISDNIRAAAEAVRDAKDDDAKAAAQKKLSELLGKFFDEDMARRQKELTQIEERLTKLRELLDRRRTKKQDILELQTKVALNEAEGLGFYDSEQPGGPKAGNVFFRTDLDGTPFGYGGVKELIVSPATGTTIPKAVSGSGSSTSKK